MTPQDIIKQAMSLLGSKTSPKKTAACRANASRPRPNGRGKRKPRQ